MRQLNRLNQYHRLWQPSQGATQQVTISELAARCFCSERHVRTLLRQAQEAGWLSWRAQSGRGKRGELTFHVAPENGEGWNGQRNDLIAECVMMQAVVSIDEAGQQISHLQERLQLTAQLLDEQLGHTQWRVWLERPDGEQALALWQQECEFFLQQEEQWQRLRQQMLQAEPELAAQQAQHQQLERQWQQLSTERQSLQTQKAALQHRRERCLGGRAVVEVERDWRLRQEQLRDLLGQQQRVQQLVVLEVQSDEVKRLMI